MFISRHSIVSIGVRIMLPTRSRSPCIFIRATIYFNQLVSTLSEELGLDYLVSDSLLDVWRTNRATDSPHVTGHRPNDGGQPGGVLDNDRGERPATVGIVDSTEYCC